MEGFLWTYRRPCNFKCSLKKNCLFIYYNLSLKKIFKMAYKYFKNNHLKILRTMLMYIELQFSR